MQKSIQSVRQFHLAMNGPISSCPTLLECDKNTADSLAKLLSSTAVWIASESPHDDVLLFRAALALEELAEWLTAHSQQDLVAAADAWTDRAYVLFGDAVASGMPAPELFSEVHRSNMTKEPSAMVSGKAVKGKNFSPPDLAGLLKGES